MRQSVFLLTAALAAGLSSLSLHAAVSIETGSYVFQHYSPDQYGAAPQNWDIAQDNRGIFYFANENGVLEFDGVSWRTIRLSNASMVRALAVDERGTVYVGGKGTFGMLRPDSAGTMRYFPLLDKVPEADRKFSDVWRILPTRAGVYFSAYERLFRLDPDGSLRVWRPVSNFGRAFSIQGELYVKTREQGLTRMQGTSLVPVAGGALFKTVGITAGYSRDDGGLIATPTGFFRLDTDGVKPFPTSADPYFAANLLYTFHVFPDGEIAAGTQKGGVVLLSRDGVIDRVLTKASGLTDDRVESIYGDRQGGVWLAGFSGITRLNPGLSRFEPDLGLAGDVQTVVRAGGSMYAGTTAGLFWMTPASGEAPRFERISGIETTVWTLVPRADELVAATSGGVFLISGKQAARKQATEIDKTQHGLLVHDVASSLRDPAVIYTAGRAGVAMLRQERDRWVKAAALAVPGQEFRSVVEDPDGRVWATTREAIWRIDFRGETVKQERFADAQGAPAGWKNARLFQGHVVFATPKGLRRFSESSGRFEPDNSLGTQFADGSRDVFSIFDSRSGDVWITGEGYHGVLLKQASGYKWLPAPLLGAGIQEIYGMWVDGDETTWAVGAKWVLYRWDRALYGQPDKDFHVLTRSISNIDSKSVVYGGAGSFNSVQLPYRENALRFEFAAPFTEDASAVEYQVRLEGSDRDWSAWGKESRKDYTHLPEGSYRFEVRAHSPHGAISESTALAFGVLPPWYRTWLAYGIYAILACFAVWGIVGWRTRQLVEEKRQLENIVAERTVEIREQRDEIHRQERKGHSLLLNILPETVAEELKTTGSVKPVAFDDVTVCFTDFVGFTLSSEKMAPAKLVDALNQYFTAFDEIIARYGLEKLKTIGDSYMFVSGLPIPRSSHAVDAVLAALEMVEVVKRLAPVTGWNIRVGLHSGPVVAGVVGIRKFAFDIWGNTVNFAARMESSGVPGRVNLSERACSMTHGLIHCEPRGAIRIKEGRELPMFLAAGPAPDLLAGPSIDGIPAAFAARYEAQFGEKPASFPPQPVISADLSRVMAAQ